MSSMNVVLPWLLNYVWKSLERLSFDVGMQTKFSRGTLSGVYRPFHTEIGKFWNTQCVNHGVRVLTNASALWTDTRALNIAFNCVCTDFRAGTSTSHLDPFVFYQKASIWKGLWIKSPGWRLSLPSHRVTRKDHILDFNFFGTNTLAVPFLWPSFCLE